MRRPEAPNPIGPARAHEPDLDCACGENFAPVAAPHECHTFPPVPPGSSARSRQLAKVKRIRAALDVDARAAVAKLLTTRASWLPWQPIEQGRYRRRMARRALVRDLALLVAATATVWLVFAVGQAWH